MLASCSPPRPSTTRRPRTSSRPPTPKRRAGRCWCRPQWWTPAEPRRLRPDGRRGDRRARPRRRQGLHRGGQPHRDLRTRQASPHRAGSSSACTPTVAADSSSSVAAFPSSWTARSSAASVSVARAPTTTTHAPAQAWPSSWLLNDPSRATPFDPACRWPRSVSGRWSPSPTASAPCRPTAARGCWPATERHVELRRGRHDDGAHLLAALGIVDADDHALRHVGEALRSTASTSSGETLAPGGLDQFAGPADVEQPRVAGSAVDPVAGVVPAVRVEGLRSARACCSRPSRRCRG